jgi:prolyl-tRNA synthetase
MRQSQLFTKTSKQVPADETALNAQLLIRAGFIYKEMAGVYGYLPLGLKVVENIKQIVREEMNALGSLEIIMTNLQRQELWETTDRWNDELVDIWFKTKLKSGSEVGLAWSHEEPITHMMKNYISSYRDLPTSVYQFQTKLRNELRAKSGIMRGREFVMKDMYTYSRNDEEHKKIYDAATAAYLKVFDRVGIGEHTFLTYASGGSFTQFSHEFQTITDAGEDIIYLDRGKKLAINKEVYNDEIINQLGLNKANIQEIKASEVGNIFSFGGTKSEQLGLYFTDQDGEDKPVILGSYGIGITRLMGVIAELFSDSKGLVWPEAIAPARVHLISIGDDEKIINQADELYNLLTDAGIDVLYDDRNVRPGEMFADADLIGIPSRVVISNKTLEADGFEYKLRKEDNAELIPKSELLKRLNISV